MRLALAPMLLCGCVMTFDEAASVRHAGKVTAGTGAVLIAAAVTAIAIDVRVNHPDEVDGVAVLSAFAILGGLTGVVVGSGIYLVGATSVPPGPPRPPPWFCTTSGRSEIGACARERDACDALRAPSFELPECREQDRAWCLFVDGAQRCLPSKWMCAVVQGQTPGHSDACTEQR